ncbi:hypothetical protein QE152_g19160 [Popillia japonica]|uniref:Transposase n=1 Tax=Popillia japonica TaxID=7064 RepID=A0AAW1KXP7_POPJA
MLIEELDEENDLEIFNVLQPRQHIRIRPNDFEKWNDTEFVQRFRLSKATVLHLLTQIEHSLLHRTNRNHAVPPLQQLLLGVKC